jgi:hypothetical protein
MDTLCVGCCVDADCPCAKNCDEGRYCERHQQELADEFQRQYLAGSDLRTAGLRLGVKRVLNELSAEVREVGR